jgi:hypothetical protein
VNNEAKQKQAGRQPKRPEADFGFLAMELFADDFREVLKKHNAPPTWEKELRFMLFCLELPKCVEVTSKAVKFGHLFAQNPEAFLKCMLSMAEVIKKRDNSLVFQVARYIDTHRDTFNYKAEAVAWKLTHYKFFPQGDVSVRVVEDARELLQRRKPASGASKKLFQFFGDEGSPAIFP